MRPPRFIKSDGILRPYLRQEAEGLLLLQVSTIVADAWNECCRRCVGGLLLQLRGRITVAAAWEDRCRCCMEELLFYKQLKWLVWYPRCGCMN